MTSVWVKVFVLPVLLILASYFLDNVQFGAFWQPLLVAAVLILVGVPMENRWLRKGNLISGVLMDVISAFFIIWGLSNMFNTASVTFTGAFLISCVIGLCELVLHKYLLSNDQPAPVSD
ncbi:DUF2512 family protein [Halobacillus sp. A5]|uniref:DUF2512 family protein n=1 Tax=Halobacillus sp. A5 TaxID=2880263 RepID=UPI0020A66DBE|nr:DUF2512 family protein [Halobacillus sp. A5]MCP3029154.1 YndM family protein [Halobacillus sp. A5]